MPTAHIYVRVSTDKQDLSPEWQRDVCLRYYETKLKDRGFGLNPTVYEDRQSGFKVQWSEREAGRALFQTVKPGDVIVAAKQDRVWRSVRDRENCLFYLANMGIEMVILDMGIDTSTAQGKFAAGIVALQAEWESNVRSERTKAAASIRRKRKVPGKRWPPPGWRYNKATEDFEPDTKERTLLTAIYQWRERRVRSIKRSCEFLASEGITRECGSRYDPVWVFRAYQAYVRGWPLEGYQMKTRVKRTDTVPIPYVTEREKAPLDRAELEAICAALKTSPAAT